MRFTGQQTPCGNHQNRKMFFHFSGRLPLLLTVLSTLLFATSCITVKKESKTPTLLKTENATKEQLLREVERFSRVDSLHAKMDLKFEDNSFAQFGSKEIYRSADGEVVVQRPSNIYLKVQVPVIKTDVAQMTSDGENFRVAILQDGGSGKFKRFVKGRNHADYSRLQKAIDENNDKGAVSQNVNAFANLRPQHFTDAMLVRPISQDNVYTHSTTFQIEEDLDQPKKSPLRIVNRGYYLLDEFVRDTSGELRILRRFWFDRVVNIRLARQQIFDARGEIESDIVYGVPGNLTENSVYANLPLRITVTRPQEKYAMTLTYQSPSSVTIGGTYPARAFMLENSWGLEEVDLDRELQEIVSGSTSSSLNIGRRTQ
ncbi:MAG: hypothetical protein KF685_04960 [Acidobacteria bacterium]|nr:hypothetical protein [Acidobacteriota bacterium]